MFALALQPWAPFQILMAYKSLHVIYGHLETPRFSPCSVFGLNFLLNESSVSLAAECKCMGNWSDYVDCKQLPITAGARLTRAVRLNRNASVSERRAKTMTDAKWLWRTEVGATQAIILWDFLLWWAIQKHIWYIFHIKILISAAYSLCHCLDYVVFTTKELLKPNLVKEKCLKPQKFTYLC